MEGDSGVGDRRKEDHITSRWTGAADPVESGGPLIGGRPASLDVVPME